MTTPLLLDWYLELPEPQSSDDPEDWSVRMRSAFRTFRLAVMARYSEGTLQRMLIHDANLVRRAAVLAIGLVGTMASNRAVAQRLCDEDGFVQRLAADTLWELWFRGGTPEQNAELQRIIQLRADEPMLSALDQLVAENGDFAEAVNQRAIVHFRRRDYIRSIQDCQRVLLLNPYHFGAQSGMGQCYLKQHNLRAALQAFEMAMQIHPGLDGMEATIQTLRDTLGNASDEV